jgi:hypothetical protein
MAKSKGKKTQGNALTQFFAFIHDHVQSINNSKIFAGLMIITLNIVSKFANFKLSKTLEAYFKYTFSRQILVFVIAWMGTRDIYIAVFITLIFVICTEYLFHEESDYFILSNDFKDYHISLLDNENSPDKVTDEDVKRAQDILEKAKNQKMDVNFVKAADVQANKSNVTYRPF